MLIDQKIKKAEEILFFVLALFIIIFFLIIKVNFNDFYRLLIQEDGIIENLQTILLFICSILSLLISIELFKGKKRWLGFLYISIFIILIFWSLEEISWGQRIFNYNIPSFFSAYNLQGETTIHNLDMFSGGFNFIHLGFILIGLWGSFTFFILLIRKKNYKLYLLFPEWFLSIYFLPTLCFYLYWETLRKVSFDKIGWEFFREGVFFIDKDQEPAEFLLYLGLFLFFLLILIGKRNRIIKK